MRRYLMEYQADSKNAAKEFCLEVLQTEEKNLEFEVINPKKGLARLLGSNETLLRVYLTEEADIAVASVVRGVLWSLLSKVGIDFEFVSEEEKEGILHVSLDSENSSSLLIGRQGKTIDTLQFLTVLLTSKFVQLDVRIILDVQDYRKRSAEKLTDLAKKIAAQVAENKKSFLMNSMSPHDRRIIHLVLEEDSLVYTESRGDGPYKRVCILPK